MSRTKVENPFVWRKWFAWYPVHIGEYRVWWETVERRKVMWGEDDVWEFRFPKNWSR